MGESAEKNTAEAERRSAGCKFLRRGAGRAFANRLHHCDRLRGVSQVERDSRPNARLALGAPADSPRAHSSSRVASRRARAPGPRSRSFHPPTGDARRHAAPPRARASLALAVARPPAPRPRARCPPRARPPRVPGGPVRAPRRPRGRDRGGAQARVQDRGEGLPPGRQPRRGPRLVRQSLRGVRGAERPVEAQAVRRGAAMGRERGDAPRRRRAAAGTTPAVSPRTISGTPGARPARRLHAATSPRRRFGATRGTAATRSSAARRRRRIGRTRRANPRETRRASAQPSPARRGTARTEPRRFCAGRG